MPDIEIRDLASIQRLAAAIEMLPSTLGSALRASDSNAEQRIHHLKRGIDRLSDALRRAERALDEAEEDDDPSGLYDAIDELRDRLRRLEDAVTQAERAASRHAVAREALVAASSHRATAAGAYLREKLNLVHSIKALDLGHYNEDGGGAGDASLPSPTSAAQSNALAIDDETRKMLEEFRGQIDTALTYALIDPRKLSEQELNGLAALRYYTREGYEKINSDRLAGRENGAADLADWALMNSDVVPRFRGVSKRHTKWFEGADRLYVEGSVISHDILFSTSSEYINAEKFADENKKRVVYYIKSKTGRDVAKVSYHSLENEILFPGRTPFKVLKVKALGDELVVFLSEQ
jgi:hypothetical protein